MMLKISAKSGYLHVDATGQFSLEEAERTFIEMLEAVAQNKVGKVLFDGRELEGEPKFMERFFYSQFAAENVAQFSGVSPSTKFACVMEVPMRDPNRFGEMVARNRGMNVTIFEHLNEALGWLGMAPANNPEAGDGNANMA